MVNNVANRMLKNVLKLTFGTGAAQVTQVIAIPFIATLYSPMALGEYYSTLAMSTILTLFIACQVQTAIPMAKDTEEVLSLFALFLVICAAFFLLLLFLNFIISSEFSYRKVINYSIIFALLTANSAVFRSFLVRSGKFSLVTKMMLVRAVLLVFVQLSFAEQLGEYALYLGFIVGEVASLAFLMILRPVRLPKKKIFKSISLKKTIKKSKNFLVYGTLQEAISVIFFNSPLIAIGMLYQQSASGEFGLVQRIVWPPAVIVLGSVVQVLYYRYGKLENYKAIKDLSLYSKAYIAALFALCILAWFLAPIIMSVILSESWLLAPDLSAFVSIWAVFQLMSAPFRASCRMYELQSLQLRIDLTALVSFCLLVIIAAIFKLNLISFVASTCLIGIFQNFILSLKVWFKYKEHENKKA